VSNAFQTNGVLLNAAWGNFLREFNFLVGLSLDGPEEIHNRYRRLRGGQGSWSGAVAAARMLRNHRVDVNAISVITDHSARHPEAIYTFHKAIGMNHMQFIPCVETDTSDRSIAAPYSVTAQAYGDFLITLFDLWRADFDGTSETTSIRFFDSVFHAYVGLQPPECTFTETCGDYVVVEHNGDVYACDFFVEPTWKLGNILEGSLGEMLNSTGQNAFGAQKSALADKCLRCRWLNMCHGGCTKDRLRDPRDDGLNHFCRAYEMFFAHADEQFRQMADAWKHSIAARASAPEVEPYDYRYLRKIGRNDSCPCGSGRKYKRCCGMTLS
jgi:uncharacterized protein